MSSDAFSSFLAATCSWVKTSRPADAQKTVVTLTPTDPFTLDMPPLLSQTAPVPDSIPHRIKRKPPPRLLELTSTEPETLAHSFKAHTDMLFPSPDLRPPSIIMNTSPPPRSHPLRYDSNSTTVLGHADLSSLKARPTSLAGRQDPRTRPRSLTLPGLSSTLELGSPSLETQGKSMAMHRPRTSPRGPRPNAASLPRSPSRPLRGTRFIPDADEPDDDTHTHTSPIRALSPSAAKRGFLRIVIPRSRLSFEQPPLGTYYHHTSGAVTCSSTLSFDFPLPPPVIVLPDLGSSVSFVESTLDALSRAGMDSASDLDLTTAPTSLRTSFMDSDSFYTVASTTGDVSQGGEVVLRKNRPLPSIPSLASSPHVPLRIRFAHPPASDIIFKENRLPTPEQLERAARLPVISEAGSEVPFYDLWKGQKTIVVFIRHFWCPMCQDYMFSISRSVSAKALRQAGVELVVISNGSFKMIPSYRKIFRTPFALYTDPTHAVYNALGMTIQSLEKGPRPSYIKHGMAGGIAMVVGNAFKSGMPLFADGGDISQLGGEFVMGPGLTCSFAHRMRYTRAHTSILTVVAEAGVDMVAHVELERGASSGRALDGMSDAEAASWMSSRRKQLKALAARKARRRGGARYCDAQDVRLPSESTHEGSAETAEDVEASGSACSTTGTATTGEMDPYGYLRSECSGAYVCSDSLCSGSPRASTSISIGASSLRSWMDRDSALSEGRSASNTTADTIVYEDAERRTCIGIAS
ncbi:hypothetical protein EV714DRAFT_242416 [Schizophyllum commune]